MKDRSGFESLFVTRLAVGIYILLEGMIQLMAYGIALSLYFTKPLTNAAGFVIEKLAYLILQVLRQIRKVLDEIS